MSLIFLDESGGRTSGRPSVFAVAGILSDAQAADRVVRRFRKEHPRWSASELKGSAMDDDHQGYVLRKALQSADTAAVVVVADNGMAHAMWAVSEFGEHRVYAALVAEVLTTLAAAAGHYPRAVADGGRYTGTIMRQIPDAVDAYCAALALVGAAAGGPAPDPPAARLSFAQSHGNAGVQLADIIANFALRAWRASRVQAGPPPAATLSVPVLPATLAALPLPPWLVQAPPPVGPGHVVVV